MVRFPICLFLPLLALSAQASGATLVVSQLSSDETPASLLTATLDFQIIGANELTLRVRNDTATPDAYLLSEIFFNASVDVTSLTLVSATSSADGLVSDEWKLASGHAGGFGRFDFQLLNAKGNSKNEIAPGESVDFVFTIGGIGPFDPSDFTSELSTIPPGEFPSLAAVKFVSGSGDDSAYGAMVPEPLTILQLGMGLAGLSWLRRR
ncbi:MAG: PEP-CTERM sorting domain-containing protein [Candidatus Rokuibacteriota bacterium]